MLSFTPLGFGMPDLTVSGFTGPVATWGGQLAVTLHVQNEGASSLIEPLDLAPNAPSTTDAPATTVAIYLTTHPVLSPRALRIATINVPAIPQVNEVRLTEIVTLPERPPMFPDQGPVWVTFQVNPDRQFLERDFTNNFGRAPQPVQFAPPLPEIQVVGLDLPPVMQPGDTIAPNIKLANYGTVDISRFGPVTVQLVASLDPFFTEGDSVVATFTIDNIRPLSVAPMKQTILGDVNVDDPPNMTTLVGAPVTLPVEPAEYFLGVVVDPLNTIPELSEIGRGPDIQLAELRTVGPPIEDLPPAGVIRVPSSIATNPFPFPAFPVRPIPSPPNNNPPNENVAARNPTESTANGRAPLARSFAEFLRQRRQPASLPIGLSRPLGGPSRLT